MSRKITTEEWIAKAKEVHGDTYDYSESEYKGQKYNIKIICKKHGAFYQQAGNHVKQHQGCPLCSKYKRKTTEEFVEKANEVHSYKYDYSKVEYKNSKTNIFGFSSQGLLVMAIILMWLGLKILALNNSPFHFHISKRIQGIEQ